MYYLCIARVGHIYNAKCIEFLFAQFKTIHYFCNIIIKDIHTMVHTITYANAEQFFANFKGCSFITFCYHKECKMNKFSNYLYGRVEVVEEVVLNFGICYQSSCEKKSITGKYANQGLHNGLKYKVYNKVLTNADGEILIRTYAKQNEQKKVTYYVGGRIATPSELNIIQQCEIKPKHFVCKNQLAHGITKQTEVRNLKLSGIEWFKVNGDTYHIV